MSQEGKIVDHHDHQRNDDDDDDDDDDQNQSAPQHEYGTFQGIPVTGYPQPARPPGAMEPPPGYYARGYQAVPGTPMRHRDRDRDREPRLPCCGIGCGWFLFIIGFFLAGIPWYFAAILLICCRNVEQREKPGYVACTIAAVVAIIATIFGVSRLTD